MVGGDAAITRVAESVRGEIDFWGITSVHEHSGAGSAVRQHEAQFAAWVEGRDHNQAEALSGQALALTRTCIGGERTPPALGVGLEVKGKPMACAIDCGVADQAREE